MIKFYSLPMARCTNKEDKRVSDRQIAKAVTDRLRNTDQCVYWIRPVYVSNKWRWYGTQDQLKELIEKLQLQDLQSGGYIIADEKSLDITDTTNQVFCHPKLHKYCAGGYCSFDFDNYVDKFIYLCTIGSMNRLAKTALVPLSSVLG